MIAYFLSPFGTALTLLLALAVWQVAVQWKALREENRP